MWFLRSTLALVVLELPMLGADEVNIKRFDGFYSAWVKGDAEACAIYLPKDAGAEGRLTYEQARERYLAVVKGHCRRRWTGAKAGSSALPPGVVIKTALYARLDTNGDFAGPLYVEESFRVDPGTGNILDYVIEDRTAQELERARRSIAQQKGILADPNADDDSGRIAQLALVFLYDEIGDFDSMYSQIAELLKKHGRGSSEMVFRRDMLRRMERVLEVWRLPGKYAEVVAGLRAEVGQSE